MPPAATSAFVRDIAMVRRILRVPAESFCLVTGLEVRPVAPGAPLARLAYIVGTQLLPPTTGPARSMTRSAIE
jgi:hypothetical protein